MALLERDAALAALASYATEARDGDGRLILVSGEAGIGKSVLIETFQGQVPDAVWSWGACDGLFTPRPLGPLFDVADLLGGELLGLCGSGAPRDELFRALLRRISEPDSLHVLVFEDVHWADEATIDLLRYLGRRLRDTGALVIVTFRDESLAPDSALRIALGEFATQRSTRRISLAPLSADAVRAMASGTRFDPADLYRLTSGNPFYLAEVLQAGAGEVPPSARDAVLARAARLDPESRGVLEFAALIGSRVELRLLTTLTACSGAAIDTLLACGLMMSDGVWVRFRHEIARLAVEESVATHRRRPMHARILDGLRRAGTGDDSGMAFHAEEAADGPAVLEYAPRAARRAAGLASHREAAAQYERSLRFASDAEPAARAELYTGLADELALIDRWQHAADAGEHALTMWLQAGQPLRAGAAQVQISRAMWRLSRGTEATEFATAAVAALEPLGPTKELARAYANLAGNRMTFGDHEPAAGFARRAQELAEPLAAYDVLSAALNTEGCVAANCGRDWTVALKKALDIAVREGFEAEAGRAFVNLHGMYCGERRFAEAERYYTDGLTYCEDHDVSTYATCLRAERILTMEKLGRWDESVALGDEVLGLASASPLNRICPYLSTGRIRVRRGEPASREYLERALEIVLGTGEPQYVVPVRLAFAEAGWLGGDLEAAREQVVLAAGISSVCDNWERGAVGVWLRRLGIGHDTDTNVAEPYQLLAVGDWQGAADRWSELDSPYEAGLALLDSDQPEAMRQALNIFTELGASAVAALTRQRMRRLGVRQIPVGPRLATRAHPLGLTQREREVLHLICAGATNAQIAAQLVISTKTVDHHVSAVLAKLGAPTRNVAAAEATRLGLVSAG